VIGDPEPFVLTTEDDNLHAPTSDHPLWTETFWLSFPIPERNTHVCIYPWFRTNIGMQAGGVLVWDDTGELPWDLTFSDYDFHTPLAADFDLRDAELPNSLRLRCVEIQQEYTARYAHPDLDIDITFRGIMTPLVSGKDGSPNHLDQPGYVTGTVTLSGERITVDAPGMRDRSWNVRLDATTVGYAWGTASPTSSFLAISIDTDAGETLVDGYLLADGESARLTSGARHTERSDGKPTTMTIDATDALGRTLHTSGTCLNRLGYTAYPGTLAWDSSVAWSINGAPGFGEDQDVWRIDDWRRARRAGL
jgi:hypothetical protein